MKAPKCRLCGELHWGGCTVFTTDGPPPKPVAVDKGFRTKGPDAADNHVVSLELANAALMAQVERLKSEIERLKTELEKALLEVELQRTTVEVALSANKKLLTSANNAVANEPANSQDANTLAAKPDRKAYQRELMRKRRAAEKAAKQPVGGGREPRG